MPKKILFVDSNHPLLHETLRAKGFQCDLFWDKTAEELIQLIPQYHAIVIRSKFRITREILDTTTHLECIGRAGAGMENIDVAYAEQKGIKCVHAPEGNKDAVAEQAIGMLLSLFNNLNRADKEVRQGLWHREQNRGEELMGKTVGIIGYGNMGSSFAERLRGFSCKVLAYDKYKKGFGSELVKETTLQELFEQADVISLHVPLTDETRYMLNDAFFNSFKKNIFVINTARGKCLHTEDLVKNIQSGKVKGACLDVLEYEAVSFENMDVEQLPAAFNYLTASDKVVLTPHIAGWTQESNEKIALVLANKMAEVLMSS